PPQAAATVDVVVVTPVGSSPVSSSDHYTYTAASAPSVTAVSPTSGPGGGGTIVNLTGTNFTGASAVSFGTTAATGYTVNSDTSITATAPTHNAGLVNVTVTTPTGTSST